MTDYKKMPDTSRVWIYQSSRALKEDEEVVIKEQLNAFIDQWTAHGSKLKACADVYHNHFIVIMVDEAAIDASGCSIDASVNMIKELELQYQLKLFARTNIAYRDEDKVVKVVDQQTFERLLDSAEIIGSTIVFDNLVKNKQEFEESWEKPLLESWHKKFLMEV